MNYFIVVDSQQEIEHLLTYKMNLKHKVVEHINYMCNWLFKLYMHGVHEFYIEQQMEIVLNSLLKEYDLIRQSLKDRLSSLDFNTLTNEMLLKREHLYIIMSIRRTGRSARQLDPVAKFIL